MIRELQIKNFKSWANSGTVKLAGLTGLFGANSSGKSAFIQTLLLMKQSQRDTDPLRVLFLGDQNALIDLGTFRDFVYQHDTDRVVMFSLKWDTELKLQLGQASYASKFIQFNSGIRALEASSEGGLPAQIIVDHLEYTFGKLVFGMRKNPEPKENDVFDLIERMEPSFTFFINDHSLDESVKKLDGKGLPRPYKFYELPDELFSEYEAPRELSKPGYRFEELISSIYYLGPIREEPRSYYAFSGSRVSDVGKRGAEAIPVLLSTLYANQRGSVLPKSQIEVRVSEALKKMGLIESFRIRSIEGSQNQFEVLIRKTPNGPEVHLNEVGFGVSQVLPVIVLLYTAPKNAILLLEQPELHLHPAAQFALGDLLIEVSRERNLQIIFESHSEHILQRIQRRVAEGEISEKDVALYFTSLDGNASKITRLKLDPYGNISNWPKDFFGNLMNEVSARTLASIDRELKDK
ncbi:MAG: DUF3696 domain-containing protein [Chloroflexi bacterium]|nr:DUF3696 domain-containing protein [Chloroflexota bacterium]